MSWIVVDIEADGPIPGDYSMIWLGATIVEPVLHQFFETKIKPISDNFVQEALDSCGFNRQDFIDNGRNPKESMEFFEEWIKKVSKDRPILVSDNNGFDAMFVSWYFWHFLGRNPFGYSSRRIGDLYCGLVRNISKNKEWKKKFRKTKHTHNPADDARGNAEALLEMQRMGLDLKLK